MFSVSIDSFEFWKSAWCYWQVENIIELLFHKGINEVVENNIENYKSINKGNVVW